MRGSRSRLTLVEMAVLISLAGVLLAVFVPTFFARLRTSKVDEANDMLTSISDAVSAYYDRSHDGQRRCLPESVGPTPAEPSPTPVPVEFEHATWQALNVSSEVDLRYSYEVVVGQSGCDRRAPEGTPLFTVRAYGDLDDDGDYSTFERSWTLDESGAVVPLGVLYVTRRVE